EAYALASRFLPILEEEARAHPANLDEFALAGLAFGLYADSLEAGLSREGRVLRGANCSVSVFMDSALVSSRQFGNCWVRPLPREEIIARLRPHAGRLQTVALWCGDGRECVERALFAAGAVRITDGFHMSEGYCAMPRDGAYPLAKYMKRVSVARFSGV
ncbi:MAG TPA: acyl-CoA reductase, partial [Clostridia bacterium]|nr:acyl-CoA reductase [Clostridia bacterium]